jgi:RNA polymerase sigma-70 factor (ECF subfamily)
MFSKMTSVVDKNLSDADLVAAIAAGNDSAFVVLMRRFNRPLYRTARSILKDDSEAEDVLQDAYLLAYRGINSFRGDAKLLTWLTRIVVNEAIAKSRKAARRAAVIQLTDVIEDGDTGDLNVDESMSQQPEQAAMRAEVRGVLEKNIDALPDVFRTVFVLRALVEMSVEEVAVCLCIPEPTVRTRFFRAKSLLRQSLSREIDFAFEEAFSFDGLRCDRIVASVMRRMRRSHDEEI